MHRRSIFIVSAVAAVCLAAGACGPRSYDDPLAVMQDGDRAPWMRLEAADQAESQLGGEEAHLALLERLTWERGHPQSLRLHALAALVELDPERARDHLRYALIQMNDWEIIRAALDQIVRRQWTELTPAIVRNYARTAWAYDDADRPERQALQKLHPDAGPRAIALDVFDGAFGAEVRERAAAWQLLGRLVGERERLIAMLDRARADSPLVADLQAAGRDLGIVPRSRQTITWVQTLRTEPYESFWRSATQAVSSLDAGQAAGLELRHLPVLVWMRARDDAALDAGRGELLRQLRSRLAGAEHHLKSTTHDGQAPDHPQRLRDWVERLSFGDLLVLGEVLRAMGDRGVRGAWFAQARADHHDRSTEYGGLLAWQADGTLSARRYNPMLRDHDRKYVSPKQLIVDAYTGLAHYHFHAQSLTHRDYAGPGRGDLERIGDRHRLNGLVLTFIDPQTLNVDFYRHGRVVIDLGTIRR